ncbi:stage IV sporulation protein FB [Salirhabdus euzebyi]|uniref:Stage IV sporulation protein FB n=1 Tax=Salirhabdus euzebyi TaxID=394506 RepID=A0A841Q1U8_9BACI|nr:site-2 protease family protein [Salirhabdus euzebyi]MBB6451915.1 stage IV sporulation protein FB [Salirhabdus euzebyi]
MNKLRVLLSLHIHPLLWLLLFLGVLTGSFVEITIIFILIFIHEMGHIGMALFFRWRIRKIMFWPFGGVMETDEYFNRPYKEEFLVVLAGPLQHVWIHGVLLLLFQIDVLPEYLIQYALSYNIKLFLFNLLPIYPLDGGKILLLLLSYKLPFKHVITYTILLSTVFIVVCFSFTYAMEWNTFHTLSLACFLLLENRLEWKRRQFFFLRHLMARYQHKGQPLSVIKKINATPSTSVYAIMQKFQKGPYYHINVPLDGGKSVIIDESQCLHAFFDLKKPYVKMGKLAEMVHT